MPDHETVKVTVNLPADEVEDLKRLAKEQKITLTDALRRAIGTEKFLRDNIKDGTKILFQHPDKTYERIVLR